MTMPALQQITPIGGQMQTLHAPTPISPGPPAPATITRAPSGIPGQSDIVDLEVLGLGELKNLVAVLERQRLEALAEAAELRKGAQDAKTAIYQRNIAAGLLAAALAWYFFIKK